MLLAGRDPKDLARELGLRVGTLRVWLLAAEGGTHRPSRARDSVLARTLRAHERFEAALTSIPESALEARLAFGQDAIDDWRIADAVAHVTHYQAGVVRQATLRPDARRVSPKSPFEQQIGDYFDPKYWSLREATDPGLARMDPWTRRRHGRNHLVFAQWRDRSVSEIMAWHRLVHEYALWWLHNGPETWFSGATPLSHGFGSALGHHSEVHLRDILKTLATPG